MVLVDVDVVVPLVVLMLVLLMLVLLMLELLIVEVLLVDVVVPHRLMVKLGPQGRLTMGYKTSLQTNSGELKG